LTTPYRVKLTVFEGPLDLLLQLIEKRELDITTVSLAQVTDQYLDYIGLLQEIDAGALAEFLVLAAKLLLIKSRLLLPQPPGLDGEREEDVGQDLAQQLLEYKRFKEAALVLRQREAQGLRAYVRVASPPELPRRLDLEGVSLNDLVEAVRQALQTRPAPPVSEVVPPLVVSIADKMAEILDSVAERGRVSFQRLLAKSRSRLEVIATFLALLELIKEHEVVVRQERLFGDILVAMRPDNETSAADTRIEE
jgi:segregation and condensation protein A